MRLVVQSYSSGELELIECPKPAIKQGCLIVETAASLVSIGTEKYMLELARKSLLGKALAQPDLVRQMIAKAQAVGILEAWREPMENPSGGKMKDASLIPDSSLKVRTREGVRRILRLFGGRSNRDVEYDFVYRNVAGKRLRILDIGGCDSLLPIAFAKTGHMVTVYDFRPYPEHHPNLTFIQGDFLCNELPSNSFDVVIMVSTLEHIGLGGYGAPEHSHADFEVVKEIRRILVAGGKAIITFPFSERESHTPIREMVYAGTPAVAF